MVGIKPEMVGLRAKTRLTEMAETIRTNHGELDGLLLEWQRKVNLEGWVRYKTRNIEDAKDLKQEVLINIFERFGEFRPELSNFETWAFNRTRQVVRSWIRIRIRECNPICRKGYRGESRYYKIVPFPEGFDIESPNSLISEIQPDSLLVDALKIAIDNMTVQDSKREPTKQTLDLLYEGKKVKEIAEIMNTSTSQIRAHLNRIKKAYQYTEELESVLI